MKTNNVSFFGRKITLNVLMLVAIAIFAASCEKEEVDLRADAATSQTSSVSMSTPPASSAAPAPDDQSIAEIAIGAGFTELEAALVYVDEEENAGLVDLFLNGTGQYTVFAPTNEAFENLYLLLDVNDITEVDSELVLDVLYYHVVEGRRAANSVVPPVRPRTLTTLLGETFSVDSSGVITDKFRQKANIVTPNISATNGIIHVIDAVLLPL